MTDQSPRLQRETGQPGGFALLIVLWTVGFLALIGTHLVAAGRADTQAAENLREAAVLEAAADGAVAQAVFTMETVQDPRWQPNGALHEVRIGHTRVLLRIDNEVDRVNLNTASLSLLRALIMEVGGPPSVAERLAAAILDWRTNGAIPRPLGAKAPQYAAAGLPYGPPGTPMQDVQEVRAVLGMTEPLFDRLAPHLTVLTDSDPDLSTRDPVVARALIDASGAADETVQGAPDDQRVLRVTATAFGSGQARYTLEAVVRPDLHATTPSLQILLRQRGHTLRGNLTVAGQS